MKTSDLGIELIKRHENLHLKAYLCPGGKWTIGFGHTADVRKGDEITVQQAIQFLHSDLESAESYASYYVITPLTQYQFDAVVSFIFNVGPGNFGNSTMLKRLNERNFSAASAEFSRWIYSSGNKLNGLIRRRNEEAFLFDNGHLPLKSNNLF